LTWWTSQARAADGPLAQQHGHDGSWRTDTDVFLVSAHNLRWACLTVVVCGLAVVVVPGSKRPHLILSGVGLSLFVLDMVLGLLRVEGRLAFVVAVALAASICIAGLAVARRPSQDSRDRTVHPMLVYVMVAVVGASAIGANVEGLKLKPYYPESYLPLIMVAIGLLVAAGMLAALNVVAQQQLTPQRISLAAGMAVLCTAGLCLAVVLQANKTWGSDMGSIPLFAATGPLIAAVALLSTVTPTSWTYRFVMTLATTIMYPILFFVTPISIALPGYYAAVFTAGNDTVRYLFSMQLAGIALGIVLAQMTSTFTKLILNSTKLRGI
jgi:hypothetical protein